MARFFFYLIFGLCWLEISQGQMGLNITCRYRGVFHVEKNIRYSLTREEGAELCHLLNCSLATIEQIELAHATGFETCRYGWTEESIVVPRIHPHPICAANNTGVYVLVSNITDRYDVYCFNYSETRQKVCEPVILPPSLIFLQDKTTDQGEQGPQPIDPFGPGSGTEAPPKDRDQEQAPDADVQEPDDSESDTTTAGYSHTEVNILYPGKIDLNQFSESVSTSASPGPAGDGDGEDGEPASHGPAGDGDGEDDNPASPGPAEDGDGFIHIIQHPEPTSVANITETPDGSYEETTQEDKNAVIPPKEKAHPEETQPETKTDDSSTKDGNRKRSDGLSRSQETTDAPGSKRAPWVPDWLIITVSLLSLALIFAICIAVNSRRRCGHKKKLVINGNKGPVEDGRMDEVNGDASKSQEMVHLVHQEHTSDTSDGLMAAEQVRNQQQVDMKIGV